MSGADDHLPVLPGRLRRLAEELDDEGIALLGGVDDRLAALVELAYALRPHRFEQRVPTYGVLLGLSPGALDGPLPDGSEVTLIPTSALDVQFARRFADGITTFAVRDHDRIVHVACFERSMADEYDLVGLQASVGGVIIQRHPSGQVRVVGPGGVVRWDGVAWRSDPPIDEWIARLEQLTDDCPVEDIRPILRFAIHELAPRGVGAILIWRPHGDDAPIHRHEPLVRNAPRLRVDSTCEAAALAHALAQTDGAALFDRESTLTGIGVRLSPSRDASATIAPLHGMRHTAARRYSHDDPHAIVIVVSESGSVTVMFRGQAFTTVEPADEPIG